VNLIARTNLSDSVKKTIDFKKVKVIKHGKTFTLVDTSEIKPNQICPLATLDNVEEINFEHNYAIVFCLNKHFIINKYGEMSFGFNVDGSYYDPINNTILCSRTKNRLKKGLYDFKGKEIISSAKYLIESHSDFKEKSPTYYVIVNKQKGKGVVNQNGKIILNCIYSEIKFKSNEQVETKLKNKEIKLLNLNELN
jgi:hypothetical protein